MKSNKNKKSKLTAKILATAALPVIIAACGSSSSATTTSAAGSTATTAAKVPLVVYSAQGYDSAMTTAFQKATGITTTLVDDSTGPLLTRVQAEASNPKWGVLWVDGDEAFAALDQQGYLLKNWEPKVNWTSAAKLVIPKDGSYIPTGLTMAGTLVYSTKTVQSPPTSWNALLSPQWKGAVGMNDPAVSGPTFPFVAGMMNYLGGVTQGESYYTKLKNNGLQVFQTNGDTLHALGTGQIKLALIQSSAGIGAGIKDPTIKTAFLAPSTLLPGVIGIDGKASAAEIAEAKQFVKFVLSPAGQKVQLSGDPSGDSLYWPVLQGVNPESAVPPLSGIKYQVVNPYKWGPQENTINGWFTSNIVN
ncbi:unnamed protein product [Acidithrix sp. C25]|nr:unnamed protein product [Acidithrix sp. C25]